MEIGPVKLYNPTLRHRFYGVGLVAYVHTYVHIDILFALQIHPFLSSYTTVIVIPQSRTWFCFISCVLLMFLVVGHDLFPLFFANGCQWSSLVQRNSHTHSNS